MNLITEYALLAAVLMPVAVIVAMNVWLVASGERDTLLFPALRAYPAIPMPDVADSTPVDAPVMREEPANDERLREAA